MRLQLREVAIMSEGEKFEVYDDEHKVGLYVKVYKRRTDDVVSD